MNPRLSLTARMSWRTLAAETRLHSFFLFLKKKACRSVFERLIIGDDKAHIIKVILKSSGFLKTGQETHLAAVAGLRTFISL